jgi:uncharacterized membrane protein YgaE (UPF0421/DUF939 family)
MGKICFISMTNKYLVPYFKDYVSVADKPYDIIFWNRDNIVEDFGAENSFPFTNKNNNKINKLLGYIKFRRFVKSVLKKNQYEKLIFLHNQAAIMIYSFLVKKYSKKSLER